MADPTDLTARVFWATTFIQRAWADHAREAPAIIEHLYGIKARSKGAIASGVAPGAKSPAGLFESDFDLFKDGHPGLGRLRVFIEQTLGEAVSKLHGGQPPAAGLRASIVESWFHITNDGGFHDAHTHGGCSWCGLYYVQSGESGGRPGGGAPNGGNRFYSPLNHGGGYTDLGNRYLNLTYVDPPARDGLLILFPSYLLHSALPYRGSVDRIVIAFNCQVTPAERG
jgi:uncharacterized protein (TIGR02466 family)